MSVRVWGRGHRDIYICRIELEIIVLLRHVGIYRRFVYLSACQYPTYITFPSPSPITTQWLLLACFHCAGKHLQEALESGQNKKKIVKKRKLKEGRNGETLGRDVRERKVLYVFSRVGKQEKYARYGLFEWDSAKKNQKSLLFGYLVCDFLSFARRVRYFFSLRPSFSPFLPSLLTSLRPSFVYFFVSFFSSRPLALFSIFSCSDFPSFISPFLFLSCLAYVITCPPLGCRFILFFPSFPFCFFSNSHRPDLPLTIFMRSLPCTKPPPPKKKKRREREREKKHTKVVQVILSRLKGSRCSDSSFNSSKRLKMFLATAVL